MKVGERGQITIPKPIRDQFGIGPDTQIGFQIINGEIVLRKVLTPFALEKWRGYCKESFQELGNENVDDFVEDIRGR